jgi:hypothetical protein
MAIFNVSNTKDTGTGSLRQAISQANARTGKDTINFDGVFADSIADTISLGGSSLKITDDLSIQGTDAKKLTVSGNKKSRVFEINSDVSVDIAGLTVANGYDSYGAGIVNYGILNFSNGIVTGNSTSENIDDKGAGILNLGTLTVINSTISDNFTTSYGSNGGGIYNSGSTLISNSTISNNSSGVYGGGGIYNSGSVVVSLSTISNNSVKGTGTSGGGIFNEGDIIINSTTISNNLADSGGGIYNQGEIIINSTTISNNLADSGGGIYNSTVPSSGMSSSRVKIRGCTISGNSAFNGGGIYNAGGSSTIIYSSNFDSNFANYGGGIYNDDFYGDGILTVEGSTFNNNSVGASIFNYGTATVSKCIFSNNKSSEGGSINNQGILTVDFTTFSNNSSEGNGGGISNNGTATVSNSTFENNKGISGGGGGIYNYGSIIVVSSTLSNNSSEFFGGGIYNTGTATVNNSTISGNLSQFQGGGIYNSGILIVGNSTIILNTVYNEENQDLGGGIYNVQKASATVKNSIVAENFANPNKNSANATAPDVVGTFISNGFNLIGKLNGSTGFKKSEQLNVPIEEVLDTTLRDNDGITKTHALVTGSRAINAGNNADIPLDTTDLDEDGNVTEQIPLDQRSSNYSRISGALVDIGAYEARVNVINGTPKSDTLIGTSDDDIITGFKGSDTLTGDFGADAFAYTSLQDAGDIITDFEPTIDKIVLRPAFERLGLSSLNYTTAIAKGYLQFASQGSNTVVLIDPDGTAGSGRVVKLVTVNNVSTSALNKSVNFAF